MSQVHSKFKIFSGKPAEDDTVGNLAAEIEKFVSESKVAAKSIGAEYLESADQLIMTLGYSEGGESYPIKINCARVGTVGADADFSALEKGMAEAAARQKNIICHELYITDKNEFFMVFMTKAE